MRRRKSLPRKIAGYLLWLVGVVLVLFALQVTVLAFPQIFMSNKVEAGTVVFYYDGEPDPNIDLMADATDQRLRGNRFYDPTRTDRVYLFREQADYERFIKLTLLKVVPQGFNLSVLGNSYLCEPIIAALGQSTGGRPEFSIWEGSIAHTAAHEIGHQYIADTIGRGGWTDLPHWKQEGLPEYIANFSSVQLDTSTSLANRISILLDDSNWGVVPTGRRGGWDRIHYEAGLMVEYLFEIEGYSLEQLIDPAITKEDTYARMTAWRASQQPDES